MTSKIIFLAGALACLTTVTAQEIRRAVPVEQPGPAGPVGLRRALPMNPVPPPLPQATAAPVPSTPQVAAASVNDTAHFLAGLPVAQNSSLVPLTREASWQYHATVFNRAWAKLAARQFAGIRQWEASYLPEANGPLPVVYYLFSGPDYLYADQFFPNARAYILAGTEPIGPLPDVTHFGGLSLDIALQNVQASLNSVFSFSFFVTQDMKSDLQHNELQGTLPIFYIFLARAGKSITDVSFITLDNNGIPHLASGPAPRSNAPGVRITFVGGPGSPPQTLYYFTTDLSNEGIHAQPGFMKFCASQNVGLSLLKSASYLMFQSGFEKVRDFLLTHSRALIQDDSGIPLKDFDPAKWNLRVFGSYSAPIDLFKEHFQPDLQALYSQSQAPPLEFGIGYRWSRTRSTLMLALHK